MQSASEIVVPGTDGAKNEMTDKGDFTKWDIQLARQLK